MSFNELKLWENLINNSFDKSKNCIGEWYRLNHEYNYLNDHECICTKKHIKHIFTIKNKINDNILIVGSDCIEKYFSDIYLNILQEQENLINKLKILKINFNTLRKSTILKLSKLNLDVNDIDKVMTNYNYRQWLNNLHSHHNIYGKAQKQYEYYNTITEFNEKDYVNFNYRLQKIKLELLNLNYIVKINFDTISPP